MPECEDEDLCKYFGRFGRVEQASVCREKESDMSRCCGFVWMAEPSKAIAILDGTSEHRIWECLVQVAWQPSEEFASVIDRADYSVLSPSWNGKQLQTRGIPKESALSPPPPADEEDVAEQEVLDADLAGEPLGDQNHDQPDEGEDGWLYVGNLRSETNEVDIEAMLSEAGKVDKVSVVRDKDGVSRKYAFVKMADQSVVDSMLHEGRKFQLEGGYKVQIGPYTGRMKKGRAAKGAYRRDGPRRDGKDGQGWNSDRDARRGDRDSRGRDSIYREARGRDWDSSNRDGVSGDRPGSGDWHPYRGGSSDRENRGRGGDRGAYASSRGDRGDRGGGAYSTYDDHRESGRDNHGKQAPPSRQPVHIPPRDRSEYHGGGAYTGGAGAYVERDRADGGPIGGGYSSSRRGALGERSHPYGRGGRDDSRHDVSDVYQSEQL